MLFNSNGVTLKLSEKARFAIDNGSIKIRVKRSGMLQQMTFTIRKSTTSNITYTELYTERLIDTSELLRIAEEIGLPVRAQNGFAFPKGTSASDFQDLE